MLSLSLIFALTGGALSAEVRINSVDEFIQFKDNVNSGTNYERTTVFLDSDLDFTGRTFEPFGYRGYNYFRGVFDGQGYAISNIVMNSTSQYVGLFGSSWGLTIRNAILDSSCSIKSSYSDSDDYVYVGGFIGEGYAYYGPCTIENSVNMGSVSFSGIISGNHHLSLGGIAGDLYSYDYESTMRNCANYGDVAHSGKSDYSWIGGIVGDCTAVNEPCTIENSVNMASISFTWNTSGVYHLHLGGIAGELYSSYRYDSTMKNCANYGDLKHSGKSDRSWIGGIAGEFYGYLPYNIVYIYNSLNYGIITHSGSTSNDLHLGGIAGQSHHTVIENCMSAGKIESTGTVSEISYIGNIVGYVYYDVSITNCIWTNDVGCDVVNGTGTPNITDTSLITALNATTISELNEYAEKDGTWSRWAMLHLNGGTINKISQDIQICGLMKGLPVPAKEGHSVDFWCVDEACSEVYNQSTTEMSGVTDLYAHWTINQYTLTFDFDNGTVSSVVLDFNATIEYPEEMTREGFNFIEWYPRPEKMPAEGITVTAQWSTTNPTDYVEIVLTREGLNETDIMEIVKKFVPEGTKFEVLKVESELYGTIATVKFNDKETAKGFIETVNASSDAKKSDIKFVYFIPGDRSFSPSFGLSIFAYFMQYLLFF